MTKADRLIIPGVEFDPSLANEFARSSPVFPALGECSLGSDRRSPLDGYVRMLTRGGGVLIIYKDQMRNLFLTTVRVLGWSLATGVDSLFIFEMWSMPLLKGFGALTAFMGVNWLIARWKIIVTHSIEIRHDMMIIDGEDVFYAEDIRDHWPEVQMRDDDPDRMAVAGICGTRYIEFTTANRRDKNDRTPEVLADDLFAAMEQLWGRREVTFATTPLV